MIDLLEYWRLEERPFEATWDTRFYFQSRAHDEALNRLCFLVGERTMNLGMLTGEIGCGKTLTRAVFAERLDPQKFRVIVQESSRFGIRDLLAAALSALEGSAVPEWESKFGRIERFRRWLRRLAEQQQHLVLIFDEAQEMSPATLTELKLLTNFNGGRHNDLTIILVGQPELHAKLRRLRPIEQRVSLRFHLKPLTLSETAAYLRHRLCAAGHPNGQLFSDEATAAAFRLCAGVPREVNRLAKLALELAWVQEMPHVSAAVVEAVGRDLEDQQTLRAA
jgi:general secretion pathway protein A